MKVISTRSKRAPVRAWMTVALAGCALVLSPASRGDPSLADLLETNLHVVVRITALPHGDAPLGSAAPTTFGTGFVVSADGLVVTNHHKELPIRATGSPSASIFSNAMSETGSAPRTRAR